jgi:hypothetical protein
MRTSCKAFLALFVGVVGVMLLTGLSPLAEWNVSPSCKRVNFNSLLHQIWCWLNFNKDSIGPIIQLLGAVGVAFAAVSFFRTQHLNQANAVFQMMKEARDLQLKLNSPPPNAASVEMKLRMGINFHASIFQYRYLNFVDETTWKPFEDDLELLMCNPDFVNWLYGGANVIHLPPIDKFDPRFIDYLKSIHRRVPGAATPP